MQKILMAMVLVGTLVTPGADAASLASKISEVTVYSYGATVTRTASLTTHAGEQRIEMAGFPADLEPERLRLELSNTEVRLGQVKVVRNELRDTDNPEVLTLRASLESVQEKIQVLEDADKAAKLQLTFLESLATGYSKEAWSGAAQANADTASWQRALTLMQGGAAQAYATLRDNARAKAELQKDAALLERQLADKRSTSQASSTVVMDLISDSARSITIQARYPQDDAQWYPVYEARLDTAKESLLLAQKAVVSQSTDEVWNDVKVILSTSEPSQDIVAPEVSSRFVNLAPPIARRSASRQDMYQAVAAPMMADSVEEIVVTGSKQVRDPSWSGTFAMNFPIPGRISISNNNDESQRFDLKSYEFAAELVTQIVPRQKTEAFLTAKLVNTGSDPLYSSSMNVFVDGVFMGEAMMPSLLPGAEVNLPMGQDPRIEVKVVDQGGKDAKSGVFKKQRIEAMDLVYQITNRRPGAALVEVRDAYPVAKNRDIKIEQADNATPPTVEDEDKQAGVMVWRKSLTAGETWSIRYAYTLTHPADERLVSGAR
ncbi:mucoidy inhibitor MuiA family protein [Arenicella chitinivorans]|nr:mucoidy inhibitor MuiA family protein [Arenicella chitinivorans]